MADWGPRALRSHWGRGGEGWHGGVNNLNSLPLLPVPVLLVHHHFPSLTPPPPPQASLYPPPSPWLLSLSLLSLFSLFFFFFSFFAFFRPSKESVLDSSDGRTGGRAAGDSPQVEAGLVEQLELALELLLPVVPPLGSSVERRTRKNKKKKFLIPS